MNVHISVNYKGGPFPELDKLIIKAMKKIKAEWYAQGFDLEDKIRDISFDIEI